MDKPLISICIPTYNRPDELKACLDSIIKGLDSGESDLIEIVVTDNSDNDKTMNMIEQVQAVFPGLKYSLNEQNIGSTENVKLALRTGRGKYLWLMGDDDLVIPGSVSLVIQRLHSVDYAAVLLNFAQGEHDDPEILTMPNCLFIKTDKTYEQPENFFDRQDFINFFGINFMSVQIYRKEYFDQIISEAGAFNKTCYPQSYIFLLCARLGKIMRIARPCVIWRMPARNRRYVEEHLNDDYIFSNYVDYIKYAKTIGFRFDDALLAQTVETKIYNLEYHKRAKIKNKLKSFLLSDRTRPAIALLLHYYRIVKMIINKLNK
jgi:glycosyltransferase involved in cell wall biosynthesis